MGLPLTSAPSVDCRRTRPRDCSRITTTSPSLVPRSKIGPARRRGWRSRAVVNVDAAVLIWSASKAQSASNPPLGSRSFTPYSEPPVCYPRRYPEPNFRLKRSPSASSKYLLYMASPAGLEPATHSLGNCCSILLSYGDSSRNDTLPARPSPADGCGSGSAADGLGIRVRVNAAAMHLTQK